MKTLYLLRGLPGAGKSTLAKVFGGIILEADQYFVEPGTQEYKFDPSKLKDAHNDCQKKCEQWMETGYQIVVSNTFTQEWEMKPYYDLANRFGYKVFSLIVENRHGSSSIHSIPKEKIDNMRERFQIKL